MEIKNYESWGWKKITGQDRKKLGQSHLIIRRPGYLVEILPRHGDMPPLLFFFFFQQFDQYHHDLNAYDKAQSP
jgi:hypothetical protein